MSRWMGSPVTTLSGGHGPSCWAFTVKNMANRPAKNISSLESHTMVPTLTMLGRFSECTRWPIVGAAVVTRGIMSWTHRGCALGVTARRGHNRHTRAVGLGSGRGYDLPRRWPLTDCEEGGRHERAAAEGSGVQPPPGGPRDDHHSCWPPSR